MEHWNKTDLTAKTISPLSNCTVDTSYRFTFYQVSYSIIFLLGLVTNSLALRRLCLPSCTMNSTAIYMLSLSTADLFFVISLPLRIYYYHQRAQALSSRTGDWSGWTHGVAFCQITFILKYISLYGGIFFLVCIAVDRYFAVVHPLASTLHRRRVAWVVSGVIWCLVLGLSVGLPLLKSLAARQNQPCLLDPSVQHHRTVILVALGVVLGSFLLPTLILLYSYCRVLRVPNQPRHHCRSHHRGRQHTLRVIYWVLGVFLLCFLPYHINLLGYTLTHMELLPHCGLAKVTKAVHPVVLSLASFNCCLNPIIYYFSSSLVHRNGPTGGGSGSH
ncbi:lysophosphatidic acid receptor 6-like [Acanthochromis polyacanthus]|uniref:lysophosphatidic acid receptor 6-like n=1 Tax=Acanthochromis polyacanthus TaxID=80966 RepID=UPI0022348970|nr:lysophosphatidic acid receptor 6-like [Acanthochromis polyacanthus]